MKTIWFSDIKDPVEQNKFKEYVKNSKGILDKLIKVCYNNIDRELDTSITDYDSPSWAYRQADANGAVRAYKELIDILTISKEP